MLDLGDAFALITKHLDSIDCHRLRHTCRLLRHNTAVVEGISSLNDASQYQEGLQQLKNLRHLRLENPSSIFDLHHLSSFSTLVRVVIVDTSVVDLRPLRGIASLRSLELEDVEHYASLPSLMQLQRLELRRTLAIPAVMQLTALTQIGLNDGSQVSRLGHLSQLEALRIITASPGLHPWEWEAESWSAADTSALSGAITAGLPALRSLACPSLLLPAVSSLVQLTSLMIFCDGEELPVPLQDLRQLTGLRKLGIFEYISQPHLLSSSVTALFCMSMWGCEDASMPHLVNCSRLQHIMLAFDEADANIEFEQLPTSAKTIWVDQAEGKVFLESRAAEVVRLRRVKNLTWRSDPAMLEAEYG